LARRRLDQIVESHRLHLHTYADDCQIYVSTPVEDAPLAVNKFITRVVGVNVWLTANRLRLNASATQLMWMDSTQMLDRIACVHGHSGRRHARRYLWIRTWSRSSRRARAVVGVARHCSLSSRLSNNQLSQLRPVIRSSSVQLQPRRLSSRSFHVAWTTATHCCTASMMGYTSPPAEFRRMVDHRRSSVWPHLTTATATALASSLSSSHVQDPGACAPVISWSYASVPRWWMPAAVGRKA